MSLDQRADWYPFVETTLASLPVTTASRADLVQGMVHDCKLGTGATERRKPRLVFDMNGQGISMLKTDQSFQAAMQKADLIHCDGGIWVKLSRFTGRAIAERSSTTDMMVDFAQACEREGLSFYILGGTAQVNAAFCDYLAKTYPRLRIAGNRDGYFSAEQENEVIEAINAAKADVVWVGTGKPREQVFSVKLRENIEAGWIVTCGGCYNYFTGDYARAPMWMQDNGLEWLHRMATQPSKFAWRYIKTNPHSLAIVLWDLAKTNLLGKKFLQKAASHA